MTHQDAGDGMRLLKYFTPDGAFILEFAVPDTGAWSVLTRDRRYILTTDRLTDEVRRWDAQTGESVTLPVLGEEQQRDLLSDGRFMIKTRSGQYELWDIEAPAPIGVLAAPGPSRLIADPVVHPDESHVWITLEGTWTQIPLDPQRWFELACEFAGRSLTEAEWRDFVPRDQAYQDACAGQVADS